MLTNHQSQIVQNPILLTQTSQSSSYPTILPSQHRITDHTKQSLPSSSSIVTETFEPISPSHTNEINQTSISSDTTTQPPVNK
jgi:hypothetical protein